jgi:hypothetical protein
MHLTKFAMLAGIGTVLVTALVTPAHAGILPCFFDRTASRRRRSPRASSRAR